MNIYEIHGHQCEKLSQFEEFYHTTMQLLKQMKNGEINLSQVKVSDNGWEIGPMEAPVVHEEG